MAIYMKLGSILGSVTTSGYEGCIALDSFQWGYSAGYTAKQSGSEVSVAEVVVTMRAEKASAAILQAGLTRSPLTPVTIKFTTTAKDGVTVFMYYNLTNCYITKHAVAAGAEGHPTETVSLSFTGVTMSFIPLDSKLTGSPTSVTYDVRSAKTQ